MDRSHITEVVYSKVLRKENKTLNWKKFDDSLKEDIVVIYMCASIQTLRLRHIQEKEEYLPPMKIQEIINEYNIYFKKSSIPLLRLSSDDKMEDNIFEAIKFISKIWTSQRLKNKK